MAKEPIETRLEKLEQELSALKSQLLICPECQAFLLMADEDREHKAGEDCKLLEHVVKSHHFQCYACGAWWKVSKDYLFNDTARYKVRGYQGTLPKNTIPQKRHSQ